MTIYVIDRCLTHGIEECTPAKGSTCAPDGSRAVRRQGRLCWISVERWFYARPNAALVARCLRAAEIDRLNKLDFGSDQ